MDVDVFIGRLPPASPQVLAGSRTGKACALFEEAGVPTTLASGIPQWETPDVTVVVRHESYAEARMWAEEIYQLFRGLANRAIGPVPTFYRTCGVRTTPYFDGVDALKLPIIAFSCAPEKALSPEV